MSSIKPLILYGHLGGPNPWKVAIILEELEVPYEHKFLEFQEMKQEPYESLNPNGRVPALEDPNTGIKVFESGAIIEYLEEVYDKSNKLRYTGLQERALTTSWLHFQMSGQGPYFGQKIWFSVYHSEKIQSAIERYSNEIKRVTGVIDRHLKKQGTPYLVGDKCTYADLSFIPWYSSMPQWFPEFDYKTEHPTFAKWLQAIMERPAAKKVAQDKENANNKN
ncbi:uncharacterized protein K452DRAFT_314344 [Aplosporella prunicola CBS 121167]|uniref:glutathione transferase n=1 Tax=Aplosporella prunicola CBS 121167 TaxID=1176127 RepID=A0A6A6BSP0_9PEZI|nr:uncharacterized protein K452DRAFT_314344 [Aplosporella prunicola CBS 121167]KAF2147122.1 hypothetical protein K452DRAFT_314344 [Aplosporella prunicola CBS 121167]